MAEGLTEQEAQEVFERLKSRPWLFRGYYKYSFCYETEDDGYHMAVWIGGDANDIYRMELKREEMLADWELKDMHFWTIEVKEEIGNG